MNKTVPERRQWRIEARRKADGHIEWLHDFPARRQRAFDVFDETVHGSSSVLYGPDDAYRLILREVDR